MISSVRIRPATPGDLEAIISLERTTENAPHWPPSAYAALFSADGQRSESCEPQRCLIVAESEGAAITGFSVGLVHPASELNHCIAEFESVAVAASSRCLGIGRALCAGVINWCRDHGATEVVLEVRSSSATAIALYTSLGFNEIGRRARYYRDPQDDALIMRLDTTKVGCSSR